MTTQTIEPGTNLFDAVVIQYGSIEALFDVAQLNGVGVTGELPPGQVVKCDNTIAVPSIQVVIPTAASTPYDSELAEPGQSIFDMAVQLYGGIEGVFDLAEKNGIRLTGELNAGTLVKASTPVNKNMRAIIKALQIKPATIVSESEAADITPEGIGYWAIGIDFIVS